MLASGELLMPLGPLPKNWQLLRSLALKEHNITNFTPLAFFHAFGAALESPAPPAGGCAGGWF
jgi:hypothetical protein